MLDQTTTTRTVTLATAPAFIPTQAMIFHVAAFYYNTYKKDFDLCRLPAALRIATRPGRVTLVDNNTAQVTSEAQPSQYYTVTRKPAACNCPDNEKNPANRPCKHRLAAALVRAAARLFDSSAPTWKAGDKAIAYAGIDTTLLDVIAVSGQDIDTRPTFDTNAPITTRNARDLFHYEEAYNPAALYVDILTDQTSPFRYRFSFIAGYDHKGNEIRIIESPEGLEYWFDLYNEIILSARQVHQRYYDILPQPVRKAIETKFARQKWAQKSNSPQDTKEYNPALEHSLAEENETAAEEARAESAILDL